MKNKIIDVIYKHFENASTTAEKIERNEMISFIMNCVSKKDNEIEISELEEKISELEIKVDNLEDKFQIMKIFRAMFQR